MTREEAFDVLANAATMVPWAHRTSVFAHAGKVLYDEIARLVKELERTKQERSGQNRKALEFLSQKMEKETEAKVLRLALEMAVSAMPDTLTSLTADDYTDQARAALEAKQ